jgi:hypothetical protein
MARFKCVVMLSVLATWITVLARGTGSEAQPSPTNDVRSWPPDTTPYVRDPVAEDYGVSGGAAPGAAGPAVFMADVLVNNTNASLATTDMNGDSEPAIAIDPSNPNQIVITTFSGSSGTNSALWHSTDGGLTWTQQFTIPSAPGVPAPGFLSCAPANPCDQTVDYGRSNLLSGVFLAPFGAPDLYSGTTNNPASAAAWNWLVQMGVTQRTNNNVAGSFGNTDQPWLLVNRDPTTAAQDNVYVAYDNFNGAPDMRVAVAYGTNPPNFTTDNQSGTSGGNVNPGHRLAVDPRTGFVYSLFQQSPGGGDDNSKSVNYRLNRSTDGGATWTLNGMGGGITVATADSDQIAPSPKFGTVNDLRGGVLHAAVDPVTGDVYYVYGNRDATTNNNRLAIRRIQFDGSGNAVVGGEVFVTGQVQAALPSVAVTSDGTVGILYFSFDGFSSDAFPIFTARVAVSSDNAATFSDIKLLTFLSPAKDSCPTVGVNCGDKQRVFGDYQQMKAVGRNFYGVFGGNGVPFGRTLANIDPIFFKISLGPKIQVPGSVTFGDTCVGSSSTATLNVCNTGSDNLQVTSITSSSPQFAVTAPSSGYPVVISPDFCFPFQATFSPTSAGIKTATFAIASNDPANPSVTVAASGNGTVPDVRITGSAAFGDVCFSAGTLAEKTISVCNVGKCDLNVTDVLLKKDVLLTEDCLDFTLVQATNPFPAPVSPDSCENVVIQFTPTSVGPKTCYLAIFTDDPDTPMKKLLVTANTPSPSIDVPPDLGFPPTVIQSVGACNTPEPFPVSNTGQCPLTITNLAITTGATEYSLAGLPSFPIILETGHIAGEGDLAAVFAPTVLGPATTRSDLGTLSVTYESDPVAHTTTTVNRTLCGEGVRTGARVLVEAGGVALPTVEALKLQRINANRNGNLLDTTDNARNLPLITVTPTAPCAPFQYHREYSTVDNPIQLLPGSYQVTATAIVNGKRRRKSVGFDVSTCDFNPTVVINF